MIFIYELADVIHEEMCSDISRDHDRGRACVRYQRGSSDPHFNHYLGLAQSIHDQLEPMIGHANVIGATRIILHEVI